MRPHAMCAACREVFAADVLRDEPVTCPACGHRGAPAGLMRPSGFPRLETFTRNYLRARATQEDEPTP